MEISHISETKHADSLMEESQKATKREWHTPEMSIFSVSEVTQGGAIPLPPEDITFAS